MDSRELMRRAEHALRTAQTENLYPVLVRRAHQSLQEEAWERHRDLTRARLRQEGIEQARWYREHPDVLDRILHAYAEALKPAVEAIQTFWDQMREAMKPAIELVLELAKDMPELRQSDFALVPQPHPGLTLRERPTQYFPPTATYGLYQPNGHYGR